MHCRASRNSRHTQTRWIQNQVANFFLNCCRGVSCFSKSCSRLLHIVIILFQWLTPLDSFLLLIKKESRLSDPSLRPIKNNLLCDASLRMKSQETSMFYLFIKINSNCSWEWNRWGCCVERKRKDCGTLTFQDISGMPLRSRFFSSDIPFTRTSLYKLEIK